MTQQNISVTSTTVAVPYDIARHYYDANILKDGGQNPPDALVTIFLPHNMHGEANKSFTDWVFSKMDYARQHHGIIPVRVKDEKFDIGLIDIQVFFSGDQQTIASLIAKYPDGFAQENAWHIDTVCKGELKHHMVVATSFNKFNPSGDISICYHNVIFGVSVTEDDVMPLDVAPLLKALSSEERSISFIAMAH